ncbi:hypothetical protein BaRGS_00024568 [Batillaria attramentaria]|uniref:Immunoglobulin subtype domain-containing protein n=1 Tax=Batillaria attramentaria TaxID=370345 RepID=A0ABD0KAT2_9CAEN
MSARILTFTVLKVDCQDTTTVVGKSATISCTFSETVSSVARPFLVTRFPLDSVDFPEHVVDCKNGHCDVANGYRYTERTGSQQIIEIPSAEKRFEGRYQCQYQTTEHQEPTSCTLLVQEFVVETPENSTPVSTAKTPLNPQHVCLINLHGEDGSCVDRSQQHAETEAEEGDKKSSADSLLNSAHQNPRIGPIRSTGNVRKEQDTEPLALDTPTDNCQDNSPNEEKTSVDGSPNANRPNPTTTPAISTGNEQVAEPLASDTPTDNYQDNSPNKEKTSVDGSPNANRPNPTTTPAISTGNEQDAQPLASDTPTDNHQDNSPNQEKTSVDGSPNANRPNPTTTPAISTGNEQVAEPLASDTPTDNYQDNSPNKEKTSVDGSPNANRPNPTTTPAISTGNEQVAEPLASDTPTDNYQDNSPNKEKTSVDGSPNANRPNPTTTPAISTGNEQDAQPLASDTPTDNHQDNSPNQEKTSVDGSPNANRPNPTTTPAISTGNAKTTLKPQDACAINIHGKDGSCVDRSRSTGCEQVAEPLASDTPTDNYQDNSPNKEKTSVDGLPNPKRQNPATTPAISTGIAESPQHKVDVATDEDPSRNSACVTSPVAELEKTQTRLMPDLGMGIQELPSKHDVMLNSVASLTPIICSAVAE